MKLIVGLGNPGGEYASTRHNIGRRILEFIAEQEKVRFTSKRSQKAAIASISWSGETLHLAYPLTYMNLSGDAVAVLVKHLKIEMARDLLIVVDDVALPFGKFRLRGEGSSGGHNGLVSIEHHLGTRVYARLRVGIGASDHGMTGNSLNEETPLRDYVLSTFRVAEEKKMKELLGKGMDSCRAWALESLTRAMNQVNASEG